MPAQHFFAAAALAGALALSAVPAAAGERVAEVRYDDLDLSTPAGAARLEKRIAHAVRKVCGEADFRNITETQDMIRCRKEAAARSSRDIALALAKARGNEELATLNTAE